MTDHICGYPDCWERRHGMSIFCITHYYDYAINNTITHAQYNDIIQKEYWDNAPNSRHALKERKSRSPYPQATNEGDAL